MISIFRSAICSAYFQADLFKQFNELAASGKFIYVGYSFGDELVFDLLSDMERSLRKYSWPGYAIMPHQPTPEVDKKMQQLGIEWIEGTFEDFVHSCRKEFGEKPKSTYSERYPIRVHDKLVQLSQEVESNIMGKYKILNQSSFVSSTREPLEFLCGNDRTMDPFKKGWDYPRKFKTISGNIYRMDAQGFVRSRLGLGASENLLYCLTGSAASGKIISSRSIAYEWYKSGNPVIYIDNPKVDTRALIDLLEQLRNSYHATFSSSDSEKISRFVTS